MPTDDGGTNTGAPSGTEPVDPVLRLDPNMIDNVSVENGPAGSTARFTLTDGRAWFTEHPVTANTDGSFDLRGAVELPVERIEVSTFGDSTPRYMAGGYIPGRYPLDRFFAPGEYGEPHCNCELCRPAPTLTPRQRAQQEERERLQMERIRAAEELSVRAKERAIETLRMILLPDELKTYDETGKIIVTGSDGNRYKIGRGIVSNVELLGDGDKVLAHLCCHPDMSPTYRTDREAAPLPYEDAHVAQILWLRYDLEKFWDTANVGWYTDVDRSRFARQRLTRLREASGA